MKAFLSKRHWKIFIAVLALCLLMCSGALAAVYPESPHPYNADSNLSFPYTHPTSADSLLITFSADTEVETNYDYIYIKCSDNTELKFTGAALASKTIEVPGNSFTIRLTSDSSVQKNGFTITDITPVGGDLLSGTCGTSITWTLNTTSGILKLSGSGAMNDYEYVYDRGDKYDDTEIYYTHPWDDYGASITTIQVGEGITALGKYAFGGLSKVTSVSLPSTLTAIGDYAFEDNDLTSVSLPSSLQSIGYGAFEGTKLTGITLPDSLKTIGGYAFYKLQLTSIDLPDGLTEIGTYAFYSTALTSVDLPASLQVLGTKAFPDACVINLPDEIPHGTDGDISWYVIGSTLHVEGTGAIPDYRWVVPKEDPDYSTAPWFDYKSQIDTVIVHSGITCLGANAFHGMSFTSVSLPSTLTTIRTNALNCSSLTAVTVPSSVTSVTSSFNSLTNVTGLYANGVSGDTVWNITNGELSVSGSIPDFSYHTMTDRYDTNYPDTPWRSYFHKITSISIASGITYVGSNAFNNCYNAKTVTVPSSVTAFGTDAFDSCSNITTVNYVTSGSTSASGWPLITFANAYANPTAYSGKAKLYVNSSELTFIPGLQGNVSAYAFYNCQNNFDQINASGGKLTSIGDYAFYRCANLKEAGMPSSVSYVGKYAFYGCSSMDYTYCLFDGLTYIGDYAFYGCSSLTGVNMRNYMDKQITYMGENAFSGCSSLTNVRMGRIETLSAGAFSSCTSLTNVELCEGLRSIDANAFYYCTALTSITLPSTLETIGRYAFSNCTSLTSLRLPASLNRIDEGAYYYCSAISSVAFPESLSELGSYAFYGCSNLKNIVFEGSAPSFFYNSTSKDKQFYNVSASVSYRPGSSWSGKLLNYGGSLKWIPVGGSCGDASWRLTENGLLQISGSGTVRSGEWNSYATDINQIVIGSNITAIADSAFSGLSNVTKVGFAGTTTQIAENAFTDMTADVYWEASDEVMRKMCADFDTPYETCFGGALNWQHSVCSVSDSNTAYTLTTVAHTLDGISAVEPDCTEAGNKAHWQCSQCFLCFADEHAQQCADAESFVVSALGHSYSELFAWTEDAPTCTVTFTCTHCSDVQQLNAAVTSEQTTAPDCLNMGATTYTAQIVFGEKEYTDQLTLTDIPSLGHSDEIDAAVPATHVTTGLTEGSHCINCGEPIIIQEIIPVVEVPIMKLPAMLTVIDEKAFSGSSISCVVLSEGCLSINAAAFADCTALRFIEIPFSVTHIDESAFEGCSDTLIIVTAAQSPAEAFAQEHGITCILR